MDHIGYKSGRYGIDIRIAGNNISNSKKYIQAYK